MHPVVRNPVLIHLVLKDSVLVDPIVRFYGSCSCGSVLIHPFLWILSEGSCLNGSCHTCPVLMNPVLMQPGPVDPVLMGLVLKDPVLTDSVMTDADPS